MMKNPARTHSEVGFDVFADTTFDGVLFDMDGTLIDSTAAVVRSWLRWAEEEGVHPRFLKAGHGQPAVKLIESAVPHERVASSLRRLIAIEESDTKGIQISSGTHTMLRTLPTPQWSIVTSSTRKLAHIRLAAAGIMAPPNIITFDDVTNGKPDPEPFIRGAQSLGVEPARCLVVEDSVAGLISGRLAGCATLAISGTHPKSELASYADAVVDSFQGVEFVTEDGALRLVLNKAEADSQKTKKQRKLTSSA